ncbi:TonB-dependent siderophore receptor [Horticoccus sp. 23ND18S-11]|uniref:TonB-dependent siderophore receptor n=1 Tax=Horticoccus sp. 23ND18S-11 TaxID=3391832 RepID=UPI0039C95F22
MKRPRLALTLSLLASTALAQSIAPPVPPTSVAALETPIELNPFVITAEVDNSYAAKDTLSGTRLRTDIKNVASSMSVITSEMLRDMGATSFYDVVDFLPSTFSYGSNEGDGNANGLRTGSPFVVRGYRSDSLSTNFFTASFPVDSYNTDRMTFTRGPNAILFGIGNPGGTVDITNNKADLRRNFQKLDLKVDSFGSFRTAFDANTVIVPQKLGLRLDVLHDDRRSNIQPSYNKRNSIFGTLTFQPAKNSLLYVSAESNHQRAQIARPFEFYDWYNLWASAGSPIKAVAKNTAAGPGWEFETTGGYPVYIPGQGVMNWGAMAYGARPIVRTARVRTISYGVGSPNQIVPLDTNIVGNGDLMEYHNENYAVFFQQRLANNLYLEIAGKHDHNYRFNRETDGNNVAIKVDPNAQLPDGTPNPNVGKAFVDVRPTEQHIPTDVNQLRATLSYEKSLSHIKVLKRGLGRFSLGGLWNNEANHQFLEQYAETNTTPLSTQRDLSNGVNLVQRRWYFLPGRENFYAGNFDPVSGNGINSSWERAASTPRNNVTRTNSYALAAQALLFDDFLSLTGGLRRDELLITSVNYVKAANGLWPDARGGAAAPVLRDVGRPYLFGAVVNVHKNFGLFYNRATNYRGFNQSNRTINQELIPTQAGEGVDTGLKFNLGGLVSGSVTYFETSQTNSLDNTMRGRKAAWINSIWEVLDPSKRPDLVTNWTDLKDQKTRGTEFELVANPTKNLRVYATASRNTNSLVDHGAILFAYLAQNYPGWQAKGSTPLLTSLSDGTTVADLIPKIQAEASDDLLVIGQKQTRVYEWQTNLITRYQFENDTALKGFAIGTAVRWRAAPIIGYYRKPTINTPLGVLDPSRPINGSASTNLDAWLDYGRTFTVANKKVRWSGQFRVQNVWNDRTAQPWSADVDNTGTVFLQQRKTPGERQFILSSTFSL